MSPWLPAKQVALSFEWGCPPNYSPVTISITPSVGKELGTDLKAYAGDQVPFGVTATLNSKPVDDSKVTWTVTGDKTADTSISNGQLTIGAGQAPGSVLTVTATYKNKTNSVQFTVTDAVLGYADIHSVVPGAATKLTIDECQWYVLVKDDVDGKGQTEALIWETDGAIPFTAGQGYETGTLGYSTWVTSINQTVQFPAFLNGLATLSKCAVPVHLYSRNMLMSWDESTDKIFPLTEADVFGTISDEPTTDIRDYTYTVDGKGVPLVLFTRNRTSSTDMCWLRSFYDNDIKPVPSQIRADGTLYGETYVSGLQYSFRPAMWVTFN